MVNDENVGLLGLKLFKRQTYENNYKLVGKWQICRIPQRTIDACTLSGINKLGFGK